MKFLATLFAAIQLALLPGALAAQDYAGARTVVTERWVEEWDPATQRWVRVADDPAGFAATQDLPVVTAASIETMAVDAVPNAARYSLPERGPRLETGLAQYGPFLVLDRHRAALLGSTDRMSPAWFDAMLRDFPGLEVLEMVEAPGTSNDIANLAVGRRIRAAGLRTHVPDGGSVRSGAVELFLAGTSRSMDDGAEFAVHSWLDNYGRQPGDFAADHPANRLYLDYYVEMGMSERRAREFYAMTNSVPHAGALWLGAADMRRWVAPAVRGVPARRALAARAAPVSAFAGFDQPLTLPAIDTRTAIALLDVTLPRTGPNIEYGDIGMHAIARLDVALLDSHAAFP
ncbi:alpha/beta hydrolase [Erythrobacter sp. JK5]|uniref:alpha/beta hydrolase n=1 Tax=Erythrobacter sp. JK5 TaxID=2829500 RepID=UPI001BA863F0|nr:alpha/beta hydrolase [Erythrobacter sp. JK5]QUL37704.1 alpha/beta hydrolase [Erythrobacter sp. JK5]